MEVNNISDDLKKQSLIQDPISIGFETAVAYMGGLTLKQLDALNISPATVHWLEESIQNNKIHYRQDGYAHSGLQLYLYNSSDLVVRSAKDFDKASPRALAWASLSEIKDFDQLVKGKQSFVNTTPKDIDDKLWHQLSEHELPVVQHVVAGALQEVFRDRTYATRFLTKTYSEQTIMPVVAAIAHRTIAHRCDKFSANILGITYADYVEDISQVLPYEPVVQNWENFRMNCYPSDTKRISKTEKIADASEAFRSKNNLPAYRF